VNLTEAVGSGDGFRSNGDISTNNHDSSEGNLANMFDGDAGSYFHASWHDYSFWRANQCYFIVNLHKEMAGLTWEWQNRSNGAGVPKIVEFWGSKDGENFTYMKTININPETKGGAWNKMEGIRYDADPTQTFSYIKIWVKECANSSHEYICAAEFKLTEINPIPEILDDGEPYDPNQDGWDVIPEIEVEPAVQ
ncbi:MAG: discoidin domain-containing protein, partial [Tannerellaceae bacterium]